MSTAIHKPSPEPVAAPAAVKAIRSSPSRASFPSRIKTWRSRLWKPALAAAALAGLVWFIKSSFFTGVGIGAEITAAVTRADLPITVTERGELESAKTVDVRCEVEGHQNKIVTIVPNGTHVKKDEVVVTFDTDQLKKTRDEQEVKWKTAE